MTAIAKIVCGAVLVTSLAVAAAGATGEDAAELRRLAALVDYLAADYPGAVKASAIVVQSEYDEQKAVIADVRRLAQAVGHGQGQLPSEVARLETDFLAKADSRAIVRDAVAIHRRLVDEYGLVLTPLVPPDLERAEALYQTACAACHGKRGRADTVQARALKPRPVSFLDGARLSRISPALAFNAVTLGVANTSMPSFETLAASDRWSLAFYVVSLRHSRAEAKRGAALVQRFGLPLTAASRGFPDCRTWTWARSCARHSLRPPRVRPSSPICGRRRRSKPAAAARSRKPGICCPRSPTLPARRTRTTSPCKPTSTASSPTRRR